MAEIDVDHAQAGVGGCAPRVQVLAQRARAVVRDAHVDEVQLLAALPPARQNRFNQRNGGFEPGVAEKRLLGYETKGGNEGGLRCGGVARGWKDGVGELEEAGVGQQALLLARLKVSVPRAAAPRRMLVRPHQIVPLNAPFELCCCSVPVPAHET